MVARLSDLREPPVLGRRYLVPVVNAFYCGKTQQWPVFGPIHNDVEFFNFTRLHYHIDARFLTTRQVRLIDRWASAQQTVAEVLFAQPMSFHETFGCAPKGRPGLAKLACTASNWPAYPFGENPKIQQLRAKHGDPALPIRRADGRLLCPHRKVDLSSLPPDENGLVTCPLHGLRVRCA